MKTLWHKSELPEFVEKGWHQVTLADIDANFALQIDPDHWSLENPDTMPEVLQTQEPEPKPELKQEDEQTEGDQ